MSAVVRSSTWINDDDGNDNGKNTVGLGPVYMEVGDHR